MPVASEAIGIGTLKHQEYVEVLVPRMLTAPFFRRHKETPSELLTAPDCHVALYFKGDPISGQ